MLKQLASHTNCLSSFVFAWSKWHNCLVIAYSSYNTPDDNLAVLSTNPYPGRLLLLGFVEGVAVQAYAIGGRSDNSRNRILKLEDGIVGTESFDKTQPVYDPELTIYDALRRCGSVHLVGNGDQTATAIQYLRSGRSFEEAMNSRSYEPDEPNFTPRISGFIDISPAAGQPKLGISMIRKSPDSDAPIHEYYTDQLPELAQLASGVGYALHTYLGNDDPLLSFDEAPFTLPLRPTAQATAEMLWQVMHPDTRLAVAVKTIAPDGATNFFIINAHQ